MTVLEQLEMTEGDFEALKASIRKDIHKQNLVQERLNRDQEKQFGEVVVRNFGAQYKLKEVTQPAPWTVDVLMTKNGKAEINYRWESTPK